MQELIVVLLFLGALAYIGNMLYKQTKEDSGCASSCCDSSVTRKSKGKIPEHLKKPSL